MIVRKFSFLLLPLLLIGSCKKDEPINQSVDFRDKLTGTYLTSTYTWSRYPSPPTYFDSTYYNNDTVLLQVQKLTTDSLSVIIMGDTFPVSNYTDTTAFAMIGCCHNEKIIQWWGDSIRVMYNTGGSAASSFGNGWVGRKQ